MVLLFRDILFTMESNYVYIENVFVYICIFLSSRTGLVNYWHISFIFLNNIITTSFCSSMYGY